jgi:hypothetical protein
MITTLLHSPLLPMVLSGLVIAVTIAHCAIVAARPANAEDAR